MDDVKDKKPRVRSPAYPSLSIHSAIEKARVIYDKEGQGRHPVPITSIAKDWEYASVNGSVLTAISALKQFGLLEELEVTGESPRQLKLTPAALNILVRDASDPLYMQTIKTCAMLPKLYQRLWAKYGWPLPGDGTIKTYLELEEHYNKAFIDGLIKDYKSTIMFAKLTPSDIIPEVEEMETDDELSPKGKKDPVIPTSEALDQKSKGTPPLPVGHKDFPLYLSNNKRAILYIPSTMTTKDYELLKKQIENHLLVIEATSVEPDA